MNDEQRADPGGNIFELTDLYEEGKSVSPQTAPHEANGDNEIIDGLARRGDLKARTSRERVHDLTDVIDDPAHARFNEALMKNITEIVERVATEIIPDIAERIIKEEIEKLKTQTVRNTLHKD